MPRWSREGREGEHGAHAVAEPRADGPVEQEVLAQRGGREEEREEKSAHDSASTSLVGVGSLYYESLMS
jgi:hypothetical protein